MRFLKSKLFVIDTTHCEGTPYDFEIRFPTKLLTCEEGEFMRLSLEAWEFNTSWPTHVGMSISILDVLTEFPDGNYTMKSIAKTIETVYNRDKNPIDPVLVCTFTDFRFHLAFDGLIGSVNISPSLALVMGLEEYYEDITEIITENPLKPRPIDNLSIGLRGVALRNFTFRSDESGALLPENLLGSIPIEAPPFQRNVWRSLKDYDVSKDLQNKQIDSIRFQVFAGSEAKTLATFFPKSIMTFRISWFEEDELSVSREADKMMVEYLRLMFVQNGVKE
jgi:hypothetical protein